MTSISFHQYACFSESLWVSLVQFIKYINKCLYGIIQHEYLSKQLLHRLFLRPLCVLQ